MTVNYQVQERIKDGSWEGKWRWFSDFRTLSEAKNMMEVYRRFYKTKEFRVEVQHIEEGGDA